MLGELLKVPLSRLVIFLCLVALLAGPGALAIWSVEPKQFAAMTTVQLVVLSVGLVMPFIVINSLVVSVAFPLHRWIRKVIFNRHTQRPRESIVAAASVFAGTLGSIVPAYGPLLWQVITGARSASGMTIVALYAETIPFCILLAIDPANYWEGSDGERHDDSSPQKVELHLHVDEKTATQKRQSSTN